MEASTDARPDRMIGLSQADCRPGKGADEGNGP